MRVTILGKRWELKFSRISDYGRCDSPDTPGKTITVRDSLRGEAFTHVLMHEVLHGADWTRDEEWIEQLSRDLARIIHHPEVQRRAGHETP